MGMANTLEILINAKDNTAQDFAKFEENLKRIADGFTKTGKKMMVAGLALGGAIGLAVREYQKEEQVVAKLTHVLRTSVGASDDQIEALKNQAVGLQNIGVVSDTTTMALQAQLGTFQLQADTIAMMTPAILDMVVAEKGINATTEDMISFGNAFGMAMEGNYAALTRRGFKIDENTKQIIEHGTETEKAAAIVEYLNSVYAGMNEQMRKTSAGGFAMLKNAVGDLQETLGEAAAPLFLDTVQKLTGMVQNFMEWFRQLSPETKEFIGKMALLTPLLLLVGGGFLFITGKLITMGVGIMHLIKWFQVLGQAGMVNIGTLVSGFAAVSLALIGAILLLEMFISLWRTFQARKGAKEAAAGATESEEAYRAYQAGEISKEEALARMHAGQARGAAGGELARGRTMFEGVGQTVREFGRIFQVDVNATFQKEDEAVDVLANNLRPVMAGL